LEGTLEEGNTGWKVNASNEGKHVQLEWVSGKIMQNWMLTLHQQAGLNGVYGVHGVYSDSHWCFRRMKFERQILKEWLRIFLFNHDWTNAPPEVARSLTFIEQQER
jgi:hypothetical protein